MISFKVIAAAVAYNQDTGLFVYTKETRSYKVGDSPSCVANGYLLISVDGYTEYAHRVAYYIMTGLIPELIDHKDRVRLNNKWENLRAADKFINAQNKGLMANNSSGVSGVFKTIDGVFRVRIASYGKRKCFGVYEDIELADLVASEVRIKIANNQHFMEKSK